MFCVSHIFLFSSIQREANCFVVQIYRSFFQDYKLFSETFVTWKYILSVANSIPSASGNPFSPRLPSWPMNGEMTYQMRMHHKHLSALNSELVLIPISRRLDSRPVRGKWSKRMQWPSAASQAQGDLEIFGIFNTHQSNLCICQW